MMTEETREITTTNYFLEPGYVVLPSAPTLISVVLGSCVSVCIFDKKRNVGGVTHFQFPGTTNPAEATTRYGNVALITLIKMMLESGSKVKHLEAQIFGGAHRKDLSPRNIGEENARMARRVLGRYRIAVTSEDVGGEKGRKIVFASHTNEIAVYRAERLRRSDWYPYTEGRR